MDLAVARAEPASSHAVHPLSTLLHAIPQGAVLLDSGGSIEYANERASQLLGPIPTDIDAEQWPERLGLHAFLTAEPVPLESLPILHALEGESGSPVDVYATRAYEGDGALVRLSANPRLEPGGSISGVLVLVKDITDERFAEEEIRATNDRLTHTVAQLEERDREAQLVTEMGDLLQSCVRLEEFYEVLINYSRHIFEQQPGGVFLLDRERRGIEAVAEWGPHRSERYFAPTECWALRRGRMHEVRTGGLAPVCGHVADRGHEYICLPLMAQGSGLGVLHLDYPAELDQVDASAAIRQARQRTMQTIAKHIALALANLELREELRAQATKDELTGLFNRRYMIEALDRELARARRTSEPVSVVLIDIDHFKQFNDSYGHAAADEVLREFGALLRRFFRGHDIPCRYGGEELVIVLPQCSAEDGVARAEDLAAKVRALEVTYGGRELGKITASMGVAAFPSHGADMQTVLKASDDAMYEAKHSGRDRVVLAGSKVPSESPADED